MNSEKKNIFQWHLGDISLGILHEELFLKKKSPPPKKEAEQESVYNFDLFLIVRFIKDWQMFYRHSLKKECSMPINKSMLII